MSREPTNKDLLKQIISDMSVDVVSSGELREFIILQKGINEQVSENYEDLNGNDKGKEGVITDVRDLKKAFGWIKWASVVLAGSGLATAAGVWVKNLLS